MRPGTPWWLEEALTAEGNPDAAPPLVGRQECDVLVVGGGYTGLWTALTLKQRDPSLSVILIDENVIGAGPSGRNGGFVHGYWEQLPGLVANLGRKPALEIACLGSQAQQSILEFIDKCGSDVWCRQAGIVMTATSAAQEATIDHVLATSNRMGTTELVSGLDLGQVHKICDSSTLRRGVFYKEAATVQPARLARALRRAIVDAGVRLYEGTHVERVEAGPVPRVHTTLGTVACRDVVLATNTALTTHAVARRHVTNLSSYIVLTEPIPTKLAELGWTGGQGFRDARMFLHYFRTTADGRIAFGTGAGPIAFAGRNGSTLSNEATVARLRAEFIRLFPDLSSVAFTHAWSGPIDMMSDHLPMFATKPGTRIHYACGFSGHGVNASWIAGQTLASLAQGRRDEWTSSPFSRRRIPGLPPEPIRYLGGRGIKAAILRVEDDRDAGAPSPLWARVGADLPQRFGLRIGTRR
jgi:glycine/D-amino acid oxidase-like deaminating enzyme